MAADYFEIVRTGRPQLGSQAIAAAGRLKELRELVDGLDKAAAHQWDAGDYTKLRNQFGVAAGQEANFLTLLGHIQKIFNGEDEYGGVQRKALLDEFQARLAGQ